VVVRHPLERYRSSNTGALAVRALAGATLVEPDDLALDRDGAYLLYPEGEPAVVAPDPPPRTLVVLDASWHQSRRMRQRIAAVRGLPVLRLPEVAAPVARMRASPGPGLVSTIEAIARALRLVEGRDDIGDALDRLFALQVARTRRVMNGAP
jgi:DTW domain-containing protein YfiP